MASPTASRLLSTLLGLTMPAALAVTLLAAPSDLAVPAAPAPAAVATDLVPVAQALPSPEYRTFTLNIKHDLSKERALEDMRRALTLGDAGGLQEMSDEEDRQSLITLLKARDWGWYMPIDGGGAIPVIWDRARFRLLEGHTVKTHGPQAGVTPSRYINVVRLREIATGKVFGYINTHVISGASRDAQLSDMSRIPRLRRHLLLLRQEIQGLFRHTEHVFISGDLNVNYLADRRRQNPGLPTDRLGDIVSFDMPLTGSFNPTSLLDYGMSVKHDGGLTKTDARIVKGFNSDHWAIQFTYRAVDLFATGPLFNAPAGELRERRRPLERTIRAIQDAESGDLVRVATGTLDDPGLLGALTSAYAEGVAVQVVVGAGTPSTAESTLETLLGADQALPSWLRRCVGTCLGGAGRQEASFVLVSRAGGTTELSMVSSAPLESASTSRASDVFVSSAPEVYATYGTVFSRMSLDTTDTANVRTVEMGEGYTAQLYPVPAAIHRDPVLKALKPVGCTGARGLRTDDGRTNVRVAVQAWSGERGQRIATRLAGLKRKGCDVVAVVGPTVKNGVREILADARVPVRTSAVGQQLLVVDGRYGAEAGAHHAFTGGPGWTDLGTGSDGVTLVLSYAGAVSSYLDGWTRTWLRGA